MANGKGRGGLYGSGMGGPPNTPPPPPLSPEEQAQRTARIEAQRMYEGFRNRYSRLSGLMKKLREDLVGLKEFANSPHYTDFANRIFTENEEVSEEDYNAEMEKIREEQDQYDADFKNRTQEILPYYLGIQTDANIYEQEVENYLNTNPSLTPEERGQLLDDTKKLLEEFLRLKRFCERIAYIWNENKKGGV